MESVLNLRGAVRASELNGHRNIGLRRMFNQRRVALLGGSLAFRTKRFVAGFQKDATTYKEVRDWMNSKFKSNPNFRVISVTVSFGCSKGFLSYKAPLLGGATQFIVWYTTTDQGVGRRPQKGGRVEFEDYWASNVGDRINTRIVAAMTRGRDVLDISFDCGGTTGTYLENVVGYLGGRFSLRNASKALVWYFTPPKTNVRLQLDTGLVALRFVSAFRFDKSTLQEAINRVKKESRKNTKLSIVGINVSCGCRKEWHDHNNEMVRSDTDANIGRQKAKELIMTEVVGLPAHQDAYMSLKHGATLVQVWLDKTGVRGVPIKGRTLKYKFENSKYYTDGTTAERMTKEIQKLRNEKKTIVSVSFSCGCAPPDWMGFLSPIPTFPGSHTQGVVWYL